MEPGKIFVGGLSPETMNDDLKHYFGSYGEVVDCIVMKTPEGKSRGFGFVKFADPDAVSAVLANQVHEVNGKVVDPKRCAMKGANNFQNKQGGGGGGGSGRPSFTGRTTKVFLGGLPHNATEDSLKTFFSTYGPVVDVVIMKDQTSGKARGFGFLTFDTEEAVDKASQDHYVTFSGKQVEVKKAEPRQGGGGGGGGRRQNFNQEQGWGDGWNQQSQSYGYPSNSSYGGYGSQGFDPNYNQQYQNNWQGQQYSSGSQGYSGQGETGYGSQSYSNGSSQANNYGGYGAQGYSSGNSYGGQGAQGYSSQGSQSYGGQGAQGYGGHGAQGYSGQSSQGYGSSDGYGSSGGGGKTSAGGSSGSYHPYKR